MVATACPRVLTGRPQGFFSSCEAVATPHSSSSPATSSFSSVVTSVPTRAVRRAATHLQHGDGWSACGHSLSPLALAVSLPAPAGPSLPSLAAVSSGSPPARPRGAQSRFRTSAVISYQAASPTAPAWSPSPSAPAVSSSRPPARPGSALSRPSQRSSVEQTDAAVSQAAPASSHSPPISAVSVSASVGESLQKQNFGILQRDGPQVPVQFRVGDHNVDRLPVLALDPDAIPFWPESFSCDPDAWVEVAPDMDEDIVDSSVTDGAYVGCPNPIPGPCACHGRGLSLIHI